MDAHDEPPRIRFSGTELLHLIVAVVVLTYAFSIVRGPLEYPQRLIPDGWVLLGAGLAVVSGFVLHELAHKWAAYRLGLWAEFRAQFMQLGASAVVAILPLQFFLSAPGAVEIYGRVTRAESGRIAVVGPVTNLMLAGMTWPWTWQVDATSPPVVVLETIAFTNAVLAVFNLIPFGPLDGRKVWYWNPFLWAGLMALAFGLVVAILLQLRPFE